jgi:hypothetical protein
VSRKQDLATELLAVLRADLRAAEDEVKRIRHEIEVVEPLASVAQTPNPTPNLSPKCVEHSVTPILLRAKNTAALVVMFLREHPGSTVGELHALMVKEGIAVGQTEYFHTVVKKLLKQGLIRKDPSSPLRGARYYAVDPQTNLVLQSRREGVTQ